MFTIQLWWYSAPVCHCHIHKERGRLVPWVIVKVSNACITRINPAGCCNVSFSSSITIKPLHTSLLQALWRKKIFLCSAICKRDLACLVTFQFYTFNLLGHGQFVFVSPDKQDWPLFGCHRTRRRSDCSICKYEIDIDIYLICEGYLWWMIFGDICLD